jgi:uncharacterized phage protein gp47/JayE
LWPCCKKNVWYDTADSEANGGTLQRFGRSIIARNPFPATQGQYTCTVTGNAASIIPAETTFKSDDADQNPGKLFILDTAYTMPGTTGSITLRALEGGTDSSLSVSETLTATSPINGVDATATVTAETVTPEDAEELEAYRAKIDEKVKTEPGSWSAADYRLVGIGITGVGQVYAYADSGNTGEVDVFIEGTTPVADPGPSASPAVIAAYTAALELVLPLSVWQVNYASSPIKNIKINIAGSSFTTAQKALILTAMTEYIADIRPFIAAADTLSERNDTLSVNNIITVITNTVPGVGFGTVTLYLPDSPPTSVSSYQFDNGIIPYLYTITYV